MVTYETDTLRFRRFTTHLQFEIRPGTGQKKPVFQCVVTFRTGAGLHLCMITSADVRPGTVRQDCKKHSKANKITRRISTVGSSTHIIARCPDGHRLVTRPSIFGARTFIVRCSEGHRPIGLDFFRSLLIGCFTHRKADFKKTRNNCADRDVCSLEL